MPPTFVAIATLWNVRGYCEESAWPLRQKFHNVARATKVQERRYSDECINEGLFALFVWKHLDYLHVFF